MPPSTRRAPPKASIPKHQALAEALIARISAGEYRVGDLLPTEADLCEEHQVARGTIRQALHRLEQLGMIVRRRAVGTMVISARPTVPYQLFPKTTDEIRDILGSTRIVRPKTSEITADAASARTLGLRRGTRWFVVVGLRVQGRPPKPVCWSEHYLQVDFPPEVVQHGRIPAVPDSYRIEQTISASTLQHDAASALDAPPGSPALVVTRRVSDDHGSLIHLEIHSHRADRFEITTIIQAGKTPSGRERKP